MSNSSVRSTKHGAITVISLFRPETKNSVDRETAAELSQAFRDFELDDTSPVAVLYGEGGTFCSGADLKAIGSPRVNRIEPTGDGPMGPTRMRLSKPTIAAITGHAVAGGLELALWCDLRVIDRSAVFGVFCRRWGVPLIDGGTIRLPRLIGESRAMDLILTGREVEAEEAISIGLANRLVETGTVLQRSIELAEQIAQSPQVTMRNDRLSALEQAGMSLEEAMYNEFSHGLVSLSDGVILPMVRQENSFRPPKEAPQSATLIDNSKTC